MKKSTKIIGQVAFLLLVVMLLDVLIILFVGVFIARLIFKVNKIVINGKEHYVFKETREVAFTTDKIKEIDFIEKEGWFSIRWDADNSVSVITLHATADRPYAWDGCSPKVQIFDLVIGTPDGAIVNEEGKAITYYASMVHDLLYQFHYQVGSGLKKKQVDAIFLDELQKRNFELAPIYHFAVRTFGFTYWLKRKQA